MKHTNFSFSWVLFLVLQLFTPLGTIAVQSLEATGVLCESSVALPPTYQFGQYISDIAAVINATDEDAETKAFVNKHAAKTVELMANIDSLFARGAFNALPTTKMRLYALFKGVDTHVWPSKATVRSWKNGIVNYKKDLISTYLAASRQEARELDYQAVLAIIALHDELTRFVLTDEFFDFSFFEALIDTCIKRPAEFACEHPYITAGIVLTLIAASGATYWYLTKKGAGVVYLEEHGDIVVPNSQYVANCSIKAMHAEKCAQQAAGDLAVYERLLRDEAAYEAFDAFAAERLQVREDARREAALGRLNVQRQQARGRDHAQQRAQIERRIRAEQERQIVTTDWLENDDVRYLLQEFDQAAVAGNELGFRNAANALQFIDSRDRLEPDVVEQNNVIYRDQERLNNSGDPMIYVGDIPADRVEHCIQENRPAGLRHDLRQAIARFHAQEGNQFDFIINTQFVSPEQRARIQQAMIAGRPVNPARRGHFFHVKAINEAAAEDGIRLVVTDTFDPSLAVVAQVCPGIRNLLRPLEE